jgi:adenine-specific DNA-methyltransferase
MSVKYMGSKRSMLANGFGEAILQQSAHADRIVDLFAGSGAVAWFAAEKTDRPVHAFDLQRYAVILSRAILDRTSPADADSLIGGWLRPVRHAGRQSRLGQLWAGDLQHLTRASVLEARRICEQAAAPGPLVSSYGGHYFSPHQALMLDLAIAHLPEADRGRSLCHAAVIAAAGYCAAAPGHTAQPFQPTPTALPYIAEAWQRDPLQHMEKWLRQIAGRHAKRRGHAQVADALSQAKTLCADDLVIVDPPYSAVQYSRFYHVLETVAREQHPDVSGVGRYPAQSERPSSAFSLRTQSAIAISELLDSLATAGCRVLLTFPSGECSNGLSGTGIVELARERFAVSAMTVKGRFSTLGGNNTVRVARHASAELLLTLIPH